MNKEEQVTLIKWERARRVKREEGQKEDNKEGKEEVEKELDKEDRVRHSKIELQQPCTIERRMIGFSWPSATQ